MFLDEEMITLLFPDNKSPFVGDRYGIRGGFIRGEGNFKIFIYINSFQELLENLLKKQTANIIKDKNNIRT